jgi:hypothetical protein
MRVPATPAITLSKSEAATRQIEAAIEALLRGDYDIAITLAGAAEDMFEREGPHLFRFLREHPKARELNGAKEWVPHLNRERDWLKHSNGPDVMEIQRAAAVSMISLI